MSVACESIASSLNEASEAEVSRVITDTQRNAGKDSYEEELDYEEEMDDAKCQSGNGNAKSEEDGELSDNDDNSAKDDLAANAKAIERDEGELDEDEELEEGEVKEEEKGDLDEPKVEFDDERNKNLTAQDERLSSRNEAPRHAKIYYNNSHWPNSSQSYSNSRYVNPNRNERISSNRNREYNPPPAAPQSTSESAWERGLKQARELLSKASKRKEEEIDFDNKRFNLTVDSSNNTYQQPQPDQVKVIRDARERSPVKRRRYSSQNSSSEDEVERRHRLAYDAAPWNNPNSSTYQSGNYRSRTTNYSATRSAETFRDPWRRSKSPKLPSTRNNKRTDVDARYGENYKSEKHNSDSRRSNSMSSLSSIDSGSSNCSGSPKSTGRKLPYARPTLETRNRYEREGGGVAGDELPYRNEYPKSRMDRIPKKSNAPSQYQSNDRISETKSFDSWSESLSDSDSSSFFSNSDSDSDDSDVETAARDKAGRISKKATEKRSQTKQNKLLEGKPTVDMSLHLKQLNRDSNSESKGTLGNAKASKSNAEKEAHKKPPIKMTFMKTQPSLKKDRLIDEQLNGEAFEMEDLEANNSRSSKISSSKSVTSNKSHSEDEESKNPPGGHKDSSSSSASSSNKVHRREELLLKLKAVEEAIERKLNSKKEA